MGLLNEVDYVLEQEKSLSQKEARLIKREVNLNKEKEDLENKARAIQEKMRKGKTIDDRAKDFCFFHYGLDFGRKLSTVKAFLDTLEEYTGQLLLINHEGGCWTSTQIIGGEMAHGRDERAIELARLKTPSCRIEYPDRGLFANVSNAKKFVHNKGWEDYDGKISLSSFLHESVKSSQSPIEGRVEVILDGLKKNAPKGFVPESEGFRVGISSPMITDFSQKPLGGSKTYDREPHIYLVVGNDAVKHYLSQQKLNVRKVKDCAAEVPSI